MSKVMHSEVQSIVEEGLWDKAIGCDNVN